MTSREIAELTGKEHFHIKRDITAMLTQLGLDASSFGGMSTDAYNRPLAVFNLPKDLTITLVSGYSVPMRHKIVTRWMELEAAKPSTQIAVSP
jgi:phage regulator Rha-like protein